MYRVYKGNKLRQLAEDDKRNKYLNIDISPGNGQRKFKMLAHNAIIDNYVPYDEEKPITHHKNRDRHDNRLLNLERFTSKENAQAREKAKREDKAN